MGDLIWIFIPISTKKTPPQRGGVFLAEMEGFEPPHVLRRLADFESAPFSRLGTSPYGYVLYHLRVKKSRLFRKFQNLWHFFHDFSIIFPAVGTETVGAVFDTVGQVAETATAFVTQGIQGAIAKQTAKGIWIRPRMTGEIFTFPVLKKIVMSHVTPPSRGKSEAVHG